MNLFEGNKMTPPANTFRHSAASRVDSALLNEVIAGLRKTPKEISPVWLYDDLGSRLFDAICELPEYYLTRVELEIMDLYADEMAQCLGPSIALVEYGSGSSVKTRRLLDRLETPEVYVPVDISRVQLLEVASAIARDYPWLRVLPLCADFAQPLQLPARADLAKRRVVYFPGSTLGNFEPAAARALLQSMRELVGRMGAVLIGVDLKKYPATLERAYNDSRTVTAQFNLNVLRHLNRELFSDFRLNQFEHRAVWIESDSRIEMRLISKCDQVVHIGDQTITVARDEFIRTERCYKFTLAGFGELAESAGFRVKRTWCDPAAQFSVQLLEGR
jgi:L-histidine N-alpha-methyltransferase